MTLAAVAGAAKICPEVPTPHLCCLRAAGTAWQAGGLRGPLLTAAELIKGDVKTGWGEGEEGNNGPDLLMWVFLPPVFAWEALCVLAARAFLGCVIIFGCLLMHQFLPAAFQVRSQRTWALPASPCAFISPFPSLLPPQEEGWGCVGHGAPLLAVLPDLVLLRVAAAG